jgi:hypothetical protein
MLSQNSNLERKGDTGIVDMGSGDGERRTGDRGQIM